MEASSSKHTLLALPLEVQGIIFSFVNKPSDLRGVTLACKSLHASVIANQKYISFSIILRELDAETLPMAMARYAATTAPWKQPFRRSEWTRQMQSTYEDKIVAFCEKHIRRQPAQPLLLQKDSTLAMAHKLLKFQSAVAKLSEFFGHCIDDPDKYNAGRDVKINAPNAANKVVDHVPMTRTERMRVEKALYIIELVRHLFPLSINGACKYKARRNSDRIFNRFWRYFAPWESCQVYCLVRWFKISMKSVFRGAYYKRFIYRENVRPHDHRTEALVVLGVEAMVSIVIKGSYKSRFYQESLDRYHGGLIHYDFRWHFDADERVWFNRDAISGSDFGRLQDCNYRQYDVGKDSGPRDAWMFTLLWVHPDGVLGGDLRNQFLTTIFRNTQLRLAVFWDRERISRTFSEDFPSYDQMVSEAEQTLSGALLEASEGWRKDNGNVNDAVVEDYVLWAGNRLFRGNTTRDKKALWDGYNNKGPESPREGTL
ncbi:hypothetical protein F5X96DRAFT_684924 [Biscogniauxia mediterranea]|nr:hypothetical protein F5X96DRAFT_684924 [Biscogniauxia mediterranea]